MIEFDIMALTLLLPVLGALVVGTAGKQMGKGASAFIASGSVGLSFLVVLYKIFDLHGPADAVNSVDLWKWADFHLNGSTIPVNFGIYIDPLSLTLMSVITGVGFLIHWFSAEYMKDDPEYTRYFCLLNVFIAAMTLLVLANNFATLIVGWGGVGFASFGLIGFWREKPSAAAASKKAFVMNVIGDVGLMYAVAVIGMEFGALDFETVFSHPALSTSASGDRLTWALLGLLIGAYAKSAQLPLHTWLPDAMEGPTPVSALIHAATMVTAGVYLLVRCHPLLEVAPGFQTGIAIMGALTALFAACCALVQNDLKRVLAYSTMSQLGYMFLAVGVGAYGAAIFHLVTHAFFKALLFLSAGIVIHTAHGEQDMRRLGGLSKDIPFTCFMFGVGGAALAGVPGTAGFFSKEAILYATHHKEGALLLFGVGAAVAILTAFYTFRAFFMTFYGPQKVEHPHLPGGPTTLSCAILTVLALFSGFGYERLSACFDPLTDNLLKLNPNRAEELANAFQIEPHVVSMPVFALSALIFIAIGVAYSMYGKGQYDKLGRNSTFLNFSRGGFGVDSGYGMIAGGFHLLGRLATKGIDRVLSAGLPSLLASSFLTMGRVLRETQTGQIRHYMISVMVSAVVLLLYALFIGGGSYL